MKSLLYTMLLLGMPITMGMLAASTSPRVATYRSDSAQNTTNSTYTFTAMSFGTAYSSRRMLVHIGARGNTTNGAIASVTIGGIAATVPINSLNTAGGNVSISAFAVATVPSGNTGNVVVNFSTNKLRCSVVVYDISGMTNNTPVDAQGVVGNGPNYSVATAKSGCIVAGSFIASASGNSWTGVVEDVDASIGGNQYSSGSFNNTTGANRTVNDSMTLPSDAVSAVVSF